VPAAVPNAGEDEVLAALVVEGVGVGVGERRGHAADAVPVVQVVAQVRGTAVLLHSRWLMGPLRRLGGGGVAVVVGGGGGGGGGSGTTILSG
jgi:hypothetical protein